MATVLGTAPGALAQLVEDVKTPDTPPVLKAQGSFFAGGEKFAQTQGELGDRGPGGHMRATMVSATARRSQVSASSFDDRRGAEGPDPSDGAALSEHEAMAVDFFHRLIVRGPREHVQAFRRRLYREYPRTIGDESWTEIVPFSFAGLYDVAPAARRVEPDVPCDPYELSAWPVRALGDGRSEVRYQFQTRNLEMLPLMRAVARALPELTFTLATLCLDDSSIESYRLCGRSVHKWTVPDRRQEVHWDRARRKFGLAGDDVYDDDEAQRSAEEGMLAEALGHWDDAGLVRGSHRPRRYRWWNAVRLRDLGTELELSMLQIGLSLGEGERKKSSRGKRRARRRPPQRQRP